MLVLTRRLGESILIGDDIEVAIFAVGSDKRGQVGVLPPSDVLILRAELLERNSFSV